MTPQEVLYTVGLVTGGLAVFGLGLGLLAIAIQKGGNDD